MVAAQAPVDNSPISLCKLCAADVPEQLRCLAKLKQMGSAGADATPVLCEMLTRSDGATDDRVVATCLEALRSFGRDAAPAGNTLSALLSHRCKLYRERDKMLVVRLRACIMVTLSEIGVPPSARQPLLDSLANIDSGIPPIEIGAAARAVGCLGEEGRAFIPYLLAALAEKFSEEEFCLDEYAPQLPLKDTTTIELEAIRALGRICRAQDRDVLAVLRRLSEDPESGLAEKRVMREAQAAIRIIDQRPLPQSHGGQ